MKNKRKASGSGSKGSMFRKPKRSKKFWAQRKTAEIAPTPQDDDENENEMESDESDPEPGNYDALVSAFAKPSNEVFSDEDGDHSDGHEGPAISGEDLEEVESGSGSEDIGNSEESEEEEEEENNDEDAIDDPFMARLETEIPSDLKLKIDGKEYRKETQTWSNIGKILVQRAEYELKEENSEKKSVKLLEKTDMQSEECNQLKRQEKLVKISMVHPPKKSHNIDHLKAQLKDNLAVANVKHLDNLLQDSLNPLQNELFAAMTTYKDLYFCQQSMGNLEEIRLVYVLHALNHMLKTRRKILKNNEKLSKDKSVGEKTGCRDQGLCRPKILIIVPFKESARRVVTVMSKLLFGSQIKGGNVSNKKRFDQDFGTEDAVRLQDKQKTKTKPEDFYQTFCGDTEDAFKIGLAVTKRTLKLYADFYSSDIILASPLGLRMVIGAEGDKERDYDFLNSIEMVILDQADVIAMQNWDHLTHIFDHLHLQPLESHGVDFSRVRLWSLNQLSPYYRQTLMFSSSTMPEVNAILSKKCRNYAGSIKSINPCLKGSISTVLASTPIMFHRFDTSSALKSTDDRFDYFVNKIMPEFQKDLMYHTLIFVPSYFDYVRIRNWSASADLDLAEICEYTKDKKVAMARDLFFHSEKHFLLYSERAHFYRRYALKGIRHLIFYQLPQSPGFFSELCNLMQPAFQNRKGGSQGNMSCTVLYCKYDVHRLASVVTSNRAELMLQNSQKHIHMFAQKQT